ncbi:hypothetical protein D3C78_1251440 [compost metagenome]
MAARPPSLSSSNMGKSMTHSGFQQFSTRPRSRPTFRRRAPMASHTTFLLSAPKKMMSPSAAPVRARISRTISSERNLATGD